MHTVQFTSHGTRRRKSRQCGVAAVEMGLMTVFLLTAVFGITELGRGIYQYDRLAKSARAAARYLASHEGGDATQQQVYIAQARNIALCGLTACGNGAEPVAPNLTLANIAAYTPADTPALANIATGYGSMDVVAITISPASKPYAFQSLMPAIIPDISFGPISVAMPRVL